MLIGPHNPRHRVVIIAEVGNNHEGSLDLALELVENAAEAGADIVKFQTFRTDYFVRPSDVARYERMRRFELSLDDFSVLAQACARAGVTFLSTPLDMPSLGSLATLVPAIKIASGDNNFWPLIDEAANLGKPIILSTGLAAIDTLSCCKDRIFERWARRGLAPGLALLHCVTSYPVPPEQANLSSIARLASRFPDTIIGYSDHTLGIEACVLATAAGARIVEKHFTLNKTQSDFRDHQLSADPGEFRDLVLRIREAESLLGDFAEDVLPSEQVNEIAVRRSIVASRDLASGTAICEEDLAWMRPGDGLPPGHEIQLLGRRLRCDCKLGETLSLDMLEGCP